MNNDDMMQRLAFIEAQIQKLQTQFNAHTHGGVSTGAGTSAATGAAFQVDNGWTLNILP